MTAHTLERLAAADAEFRDARMYGRSRAIEAALKAADAETARLREVRDRLAALADGEGEPVLRIARSLHTSNRGTARKVIAAGRTLGAARLYDMATMEGMGL